MLKFIHPTDTHLVEPGQALYGLDPSWRLRQALKCIDDDHADAWFVVITGDLAHGGQPRAYAALREELRGLKMPVFFGHLHRPIAGNWRGIPLSTVRGTNHQVALTLHDSPLVGGSQEPPQFAVVLADAEQTIVHLHDFGDRSPRFDL